MVTSLVALVPAELVVGPASALLRFQLAAVGTVGEGLAEAVRAGTSQLDPAVLATLAGLSAVVVASFLVAGVVGLTAAVARSPRRLVPTRGGGRWPSGSARAGWTAGACGGSPRCGSRSS